MFFIADLIACSTCFGHHYAHHQELESIIQMVAACGIWCFGFQVVGMFWHFISTYVKHILRIKNITVEYSKKYSKGRAFTPHTRLKT